MMRKIISGIVLTLLIAACGGNQEGEPITGDNVTVQMFDNRFEYTEITIPEGGTVTFAGAGRNPHNAVAADDSWSTEDVFGSLDMLEGDEASLSFDTAGEYVFYCTFHGNADGGGMAGKLIVEAPGQ